MDSGSSGQKQEAVTALETFLRVCLSSVLIAGCATKQIRYEKDPPLGTYDIILRAIGYDENGLPVLGTSLVERPSKSGDHFTVVRFLEKKPVISYDIVVVRQAPDFARPLQVVYEWTGKGFTQGVDVTRALAGSLRGVQVQSGDEARFLLVIIVMPIAAGTAGGFIVGAADGARHVVLEMSKMIVPGEQLVTYTTFEYDGLNRLVLMRMLSPDGMHELVRTKFVYEGAGTVPLRTTVKTLAEGTEREIK